MFYFRLLLLAAGVVLAALFLNRRERREKAPAEEAPPEEGDSPGEPADLNEIFLQNAAGRECVNLVKVFNSPECGILRSLLDAAGIESYVKSNQFGTLYPTYDINNFATNIIAVYAEKAAEAKGIVEDYIANTLQDRERASAPESRALKAGSLLSGIPYRTNGFYPELLI